MLKQILAGGSVLALVLVGSLSAQAQAPTPAPSPRPPAPQGQQGAPAPQVSPEEVQKFANAVRQLQGIQQQAQTEMVQAVERTGLSAQRFTEISRSQREPQTQLSQAVTAQERQKFQQASARVGEIQQSTQSRMEQAVQTQGLEVQRFNQIFAAVQQDPSLLQRVQQILQAPGSGGAPASPAPAASPRS